MKIIHFSSLITLTGAIIIAVGTLFKSTIKKSIIIALGLTIAAMGTFWTEIDFNKFKSEITSLNEYILSTITGGDSFCRLSLVSINSTTNNALMGLIHIGEYPLYEIHLRTVDIEKFKKLPEDFTYEDMLETEMNMNVGNLPPGNARILRKINLGPTNEKKFNIFIIARNGFLSQSLWLKRIEGIWIMATRIKKNEDIIYEKTDPSFPLNENQQVNWDSF